MRQHKMVLEVEFFVCRGEDVGTVAREVAESVFENVDACGESGACVSGVPRIVSFNKKPLPKTEEEAEEDLAEAEAEAEMKVSAIKFIEESPSQAYICLCAGYRYFSGTLQAVNPSHIALRDRYGTTRRIPRDKIQEAWDEEDCEHGLPSTGSMECPQCIRTEAAKAAKVEARQRKAEAEARAAKVEARAAKVEANLKAKKAKANLKAKTVKVKTVKAKTVKAKTVKAKTVKAKTVKAKVRRAVEDRT